MLSQDEANDEGKDIGIQFGCQLGFHYLELKDTPFSLLAFLGNLLHLRFQGSGLSLKFLEAARVNLLPVC